MPVMNVAMGSKVRRSSDIGGLLRRARCRSNAPTAALVGVTTRLWTVSIGMTSPSSGREPWMPVTPHWHPSPMSLHVKGAWKGWSGQTVVELTDGSVWKQVEYHYEYHYAYRPEVTLQADKMLVTGMNRPIRVRRVR